MEGNTSMSIRFSLQRRARHGFVPALAVVVLAALAPSMTAAASSGGWNNIGHGPTTSVPAINGKVDTLLPVGQTMYVGGDFTNAGGIAAADHIAKWNGTSWSAIGGGLGDAASAVYAIAVDGNDVYAGGSFQNAGGDPAADIIAMFDGSHWHSLAHIGASGPLDGPVFALAIIGRVLYIGGGFDNANGIDAADSIVAYNMDTHVWSAMLPQAGQLSTVSSMVPDGAGGLFVGGNFLDAAGIPQADYVAEWNGGTSWSALGSDQAGTNGALNNRVRGLARSGSNLYVVGDFTDARSIQAADNVARWDGTHWNAVGNGAFAAGTALYGAYAVGSNLVVVGYFKNAAGNAKADSVAAFVNGHWTNVGSNPAGTDGPVGLNSTLFTVSGIGPRLYVGGLEQQIGGSTMNAFAAWYRIRQPDALISTGTTFVGNNVYNATASGQSVQHGIQTGSTGTFTIKLTNDGLITDTFKVSGPGSSAGFTATYLVGSTNVTAQVVAGTYTISSLAPGAAASMVLKVKVGNSVAVGTTHSWLVKQTSTVTGGFTDAVQAVAKATN
jgi:hypothetical protein